jgi:adenylate cyclase class 2
MREIEIKIKVKNLDDLEKKLKKEGCVFCEPINQHDTTYSQGGNKSVYTCTKEGDIMLRIRRQDKNSEFNIKKQCSCESDNIEYETHISDPDSMDKTLKLIGWIPQVEVKKIRRKGKWGIYEICLDQVDKLGSFLEIEKLTDDDSDPNEVREELFDKIKVLGLDKSDEETRGYDTQIFQLESN